MDRSFISDETLGNLIRNLVKEFKSPNHEEYMTQLLETLLTNPLLYENKRVLSTLIDPALGSEDE